MVLEKKLEEEGIDTSELDIDFSGELSIEELQTVQDMIIEQILEDRDSEVLYSDDIDYYHPESVPESGDYISVEELAGRWAAVEAEGLNMDEDTFTTGFRVEKDSASKLYSRVGEVFLDFAEEEINDKREGKIEFARSVLEEEVNIQEALDWFERRDELDFKEFNSNLFPDDRDLRLGKNEKVYEQTLNSYWPEIRDLEISDGEKLKRGVLLDVAKTLEGLVPNKDPEFRERADRFQEVLHKFRPEQYSSRLEDDSEYMVTNVVGGRKINSLSVELSTCLTRYGPELDDYLEDNLRKEAPLMHDRDPFTFIQAVGKDGELAGYTRSFVMQDSEENYFLGLDTVEVPGVAGVEMDRIEQHFGQYEDIVSAAALGVLKLGVDLDVDYVAGRDARVKFGPRQGYRNTSRNLEYEKIGDTVPYYSSAYGPEERIVERYHVETGREETWRCTYEERKPGFAIYHEPGEQEVRGFRTEPGTHSSESKILMRLPE